MLPVTSLAKSVELSHVDSESVVGPNRKQHVDTRTTVGVADETYVFFLFLFCLPSRSVYYRLFTTVTSPWSQSRIHAYVPAKHTLLKRNNINNAQQTGAVFLFFSS